MAKRSSSHAWLREHFNDPYVKAAQKNGYRSRAAFKLAEIHERDRLFKPGMIVVDLGSAPGGWAQFAKSRVGCNGRVIAIDLLPMAPLEGVKFIQGDFGDDMVLKALEYCLDGGKADVVLSDMSPNMSGNRAVDQARSMHLVEMASDTAIQILKPSGILLVKLFQGEGIDSYQKQMKCLFVDVAVRKPTASRDRSREFYLLAQGLRF